MSHDVIVGFAIVVEFALARWRVVLKRGRDEIPIDEKLFSFSAICGKPAWTRGEALMIAVQSPQNCSRV
jgi:hypothetical protein